MPMTNGRLDPLHMSHMSHMSESSYPIPMPWESRLSIGPTNLRSPNAALKRAATGLRNLLAPTLNGHCVANPAYLRHHCTVSSTLPTSGNSTSAAVRLLLLC